MHRWLALASVLTLAYLAPSRGQADSNIPVHDGLWSLELGVQSLSGSGSLIGLSARHHLSDRTAIRLGFAGRVAGSDRNESSSYEYISPDTSIITPSDGRGGSSDERDVTLFAHWVRYHGLEEHFGMTFEAGPTAHWRSTEYFDQFGYPDQDFAYASDNDLWEYGLDVQVGFEWFFTRHVSLAARYGIAALRTNERRTQEEFRSSSFYQYATHNYTETHSDGFALRTVFPLVSLNASW